MRTRTMPLALALGVLASVINGTWGPPAVRQVKAAAE